MTLNDDLVVWLGNFGAGPEDKVADALLGPGIGAAELDQVPRQKGEASGSVSSGPLSVGPRLDNDSSSQDYYDRIRIMEHDKTSSIFHRWPMGERIRHIILHQAPIIRELSGFRRYPFMYLPSQLGFLCQQITNTAEVPGSILEVGAAWGATTVFLNRHIDDLGLDVDYYAIDTFNGFTDDDIQYEHARGRLYSYNTMFRGNSKAWFDRTMRRNGIRRVTSLCGDATTADYRKIAPFRFVLIDVDLYRPVLATLKAIYDLVSPGGTIIIDDCKKGGEWEGAYEAFIEFTQANGIEAVIAHGKLGMITKPRFND
jgi:predicted O-methyltransferase YrrM